MSDRRRAGFSLIEVVVLIVVVGIALAGVLLVFQTSTRASADPQVQKQALAVAEALLDEILLASYDPLPGAGTRADFDDVDDYAGYSTAGGIRDIQGNPVPGLEAYNITSVTVTPTALTDTGAVLPTVNEAKRITVTVAGPQAFGVTLDGYRLKYAGP
jgi:MSHA pilin protein MshD